MNCYILQQIVTLPTRSRNNLHCIKYIAPRLYLRHNLFDSISSSHRIRILGSDIVILKASKHHTSRHHKGTILVVEDHEDVRDVAVNMLLNEGFQVLTAKDADSGLEEFKKHFHIDLVFTDLILPGGASGIDMAKEILKISPASQFLMTSGYREKGEALQSQTAELTNISYVPKPYDVEELPKIISSLIEKARFPR